MYKLVVATLVLPLMAGCASWVTGNAAKWPWSQGTALCKSNGCDLNDAIAAFEAASEYCRSVHNYYESGGRKSGASQFIVGAVGTVAGTVVAPLASGTAAKALAGVSGAANAVQLSMDEAFSTSVAVRRRVAVAEAASSAAATFNAESQDNGKRVTLAINMARDCSMAGAKADQAALQAISK